MKAVIEDSSIQKQYLVTRSPASGCGVCTRLSPRGNARMKITKRHLRKIIKEAINEAREPMTPDYVFNALTKGKSARTGTPFIDTAMDGLATGDGRIVANAIMDALWVDDPPVGADKELEGLVLDLPPDADEYDLAAVAAEWGTRHFRG